MSFLSEDIMVVGREEQDTNTRRGTMMESQGNESVQRKDGKMN